MSVLYTFSLRKSLGVSPAKVAKGSRRRSQVSVEGKYNRRGSVQRSLPPPVSLQQEGTNRTVELASPTPAKNFSQHLTDEAEKANKQPFAMSKEQVSKVCRENGHVNNNYHQQSSTQEPPKAEGKPKTPPPVSATFSLRSVNHATICEMRNICFCCCCMRMERENGIRRSGRGAEARAWEWKR
jgi:hypothetical protein